MKEGKYVTPSTDTIMRYEANINPFAKETLKM